MDRNKLILTFLLTATIVPVTLATWWFGVVSERGVSATSNKGVLVIPVLDLPALDLKDAAGNPAYLTFEEMTDGVSPEDYDPRPWQLLYLDDGKCNATCIDRLYFLRQLHVRLGADAERVERVYVQAADGATELQPGLATFMEAEHPGLRAVFANPENLRATLARTVEDGVDPIAQHYIYVADPVGNVMLYFTPANTPEQILSDIDKLLKNSPLG